MICAPQLECRYCQRIYSVKRWFEEGGRGEKDCYWIIEE